MVKNPLPVQETSEMCVRSLSQEDPLEEEMATHSSILARKIPWTKEPGRLQVSRVAKSWTQLSGLAHSTLCNICKYRDIYRVEKKL